MQSYSQLQSGIVVVDDHPENLRILQKLLTEQGYKVRPASNGRRAITLAQALAPDLILLDIRMPEMDGFEVCARLQADACTRDIPVICISALHDTADKVKAFALGAVDYITKPFQADEVLARVRTHITLRKTQSTLQAEILRRQQAEDALQGVNAQLRATNRQLHEANAQKDTFLTIIAHDLRSPFNILLGLTKVLMEGSVRYAPEQLDHKLRLIHAASQKSYDLLENLLEWSRLERGLLNCEPGQFRLANLAERNIRLFQANANYKQITLSNRVFNGVQVYADFKIMDTVVRNLLSNALKFTTAGGEIIISSALHEEIVDLIVSDTGIGMTAEHLDRLFRLDVKASTQGTAGESGSGLGLLLCKELIEKNGGALRIESKTGQGTTCIVSLPANPPN